MTEFERGGKLEGLKNEGLLQVEEKEEVEERETRWRRSAREKHGGERAESASRTRMKII